MPSVKYSFSASALMFANGSTATDFAAEITGCGSEAVSVGVTRLPLARACAKVEVVAKRPAASVDIALVTARARAREHFREAHEEVWRFP